MTEQASHNNDLTPEEKAFLSENTHGFIKSGMLRRYRDWIEDPETLIETTRDLNDHKITDADPASARYDALGAETPIYFYGRKDPETPYPVQIMVVSRVDWLKGNNVPASSAELGSINTETGEVVVVAKHFTDEDVKFAFERMQAAPTPGN